MRQLCCVFAYVLLSLTAQGQDRPLILEPSGIASTTRPLGAIIQPIRCDSKQAVYVRPHRTDSVVRVSADGQRVVEFSFSVVPEASDPSVLDFAVDPDGRQVYLLAEAPEPQIAVFDSDGSYRKRILLERGILPRRFAVFGNGDFAIFGQRRPAAGGMGKPFGALLTASGTITAPITLPAADEKRMRQQASKIPLSEQLDLSLAETGDDGKVYLARPTATGPVYVIGPGGNVERTVLLRGPKNWMMNSFRVAAGRIAVLFVSPSEVKGNTEGLIQVLELDSEAVVAEYAPSLNLGLGFGCFAKDSFSFVRGGRKLQIVAAVAK